MMKKAHKVSLCIWSVNEGERLVSPPLGDGHSNRLNFVEVVGRVGQESTKFHELLFVTIAWTSVLRSSRYGAMKSDTAV